MEKRKKMLLFLWIGIFLCSTLFFLKANPASALTGLLVSEKELGELCIHQTIPMAKEVKETQGKQPVEKAETAKENEKAQENKKNIEITVTGDPLVIIYHTHSSESYMPFSESNYHREAEEGTVRDVGNVLENELKKKGINVVHDKTIHDRPSYNESYNRSLETVSNLIAKYPTAIYVIDLHRDAAPSSATEGKYIEIDGERVAKFSMVVGQQNDNYAELYGYAKKISETAESMYSGFGGPIIEKNYMYNEYLTDRCLLLEVGNNKNTIEESRLCGEYFAQVLAKIITEEQ
ncbi:MAG: stage II sporulation protein P [Clostridiales bacterium]|nr:stage II sporulation protein P [Clostridiales bacterium]